MMKLYLDRETLLKVARANRETYATAEPFPHIVLDGLMQEEALDRVLEEFPKPESAVWKEYKNYHEGKLETQGEGNIGVDTSLLLYQFNSAPFLSFLETLTGIENLIPDPYFFGGGLHQIPRGGKLGIHADFSRHGKLPLDRRLNVLIYLNRDWKKDYGGELELWDSDMSRCVKKILPHYNRMVIFSITDWAFHGHPEPLTCPEGMTRKSIALYYFSNGRPPGETQEGKLSTLFMQRPGEVVPEGTIFSRDKYTGLQERRARQVVPTREKLAARAKHVVRQVTPPILIDAAKFLLRRQ
jgi:Rps23 Pro-64 3,4-dihydroxylase Tpa1-like proline 4-hydroxylase